MKTKIIIAIMSISVLLIASCKKEGTGGKAKITGKVMHHIVPIPNAVVYIKYGAKESPGTDPSNYDASVTADANASYEIINLQKGDYYLFAIGYDGSISNTVKGGLPISIKKKTETKTTNVAVVE
jgi:hypothetical protein